MRIAFIRPGMFGRQSKDAMQPLVFAIIKALTPEDVEIVFFDEMVEEIPGDLEADAVAMTVDTFSARRAYKLAGLFRDKGMKVIMGGFHPTMLPEECLEHADAVVIGEAEDTWKTVIDDLESNDLKGRYISRNDTELSGVRFDYSAFEGKKYNRIGLVQFGRGCKFSCDFCSIHALYKDSIRCKDVAVVAEEVEQMKEKFLFFIDDNIFADEEKARELFRALIPLNKKWFCQISMDAARDKELLKLMKQAGCMLVLIGFESLNIDNLRLMNKGANIKNINYTEIISNIYDCRLMIYGTFVIGYDFDTVENVRDTLKFAIDNRFAIANFNPLMPMPGTPLYERLKTENRLLHGRWWIDEDYRYGDALLSPGKLTGSELTEVCRDARFEFNSCKNIFKRLLGRVNSSSLENMTVFLTANLISRKEIMSKQGKELGG
jgi:radical SAM superfamily enzyme YgiQ (UPF0313 family)